MYDVSIAYVSTFPQTEPELILGKFPKEVHFHIKRHAVTSLPISEEGLQQWCCKRWAEKEDRLRCFYEQGKFTCEDHTKENIQHDGAVSNNADIDGAVKTEETPVRLSEKPGAASTKTVNPKVMLRITLVYWTLFVVGISLLMYHSWVIRWLTVLQICFYLYMGHGYGGFELFQADYFNLRFNKKKRA